MMGTEKLGSSNFDQFPSGSMQFSTISDPNAPPEFWPNSGDPILSAATSPAGFESAPSDPMRYSAPLNGPFAPSYGQLSGGFVLMRPQTTASPSGHGYYSRFYSSQPPAEPAADSYAQPFQPTDSAAFGANQQHQFLRARPSSYGSYVSGAPSQPDLGLYPPLASSSYTNQEHQALQYGAYNMDQLQASAAAAADQITAAASSDTPSYPDPSQLMQSTAAGQRQQVQFGAVQANQRRLGATASAKLDEKERNLLRQQQGQAEPRKSRPNLERFVGDDQSTRHLQAGQGKGLNSLGPVGRQWSGANSTSLWSSSVTSGGELKGQSKRMKQQLPFVIRPPPSQTKANDDLGSQIRVASSPRTVQTSRSQTTRPPTYLLIGPDSSQTQWQVAGEPAPSALEKRPGQTPAQANVDAVTGQSSLLAASNPSDRASGWQSLETTRQQFGPEAAKKSLPQGANEFDSLAAVATDDEGDDEREQSAGDSNNNKPATKDKTARLRRLAVTRFDSLDAAGPTANISAEAFSNPLVDFLSGHLRDFEPSSSSSSGQGKSGHLFGGPREKFETGDKANEEIGHGKYQIDAAGGSGSGNSFESGATSGGGVSADADKGTMANKLIEATASPAANNAAASVSLATPIVTGAPPTQQDQRHQYHNHRSQPESDNDKPAETSVNGNVVVELSSAERRGDYDDDDHHDKAADGGADKQAPIGGHRSGGQLGESETAEDRRRSFRGLVAGSIGTR